MLYTKTTRVWNRSDRAGFTPQTDPTDYTSVLRSRQTGPGFLRSVLGEIKTDLTEVYLGYLISPKRETGKGEQK